MPIICFIRTTHENGQFRSFPPEAHPFWREQGVIVGVVLRPECALTLLNLRPRARSKPCNRFLQRLFLPPDETWLTWGLGSGRRCDDRVGSIAAACAIANWRTGDMKG